MPDSTDAAKTDTPKTEVANKTPGLRQRLQRWLLPATILVMAGGILLLIAGNWNGWASERPSQQTDDAYVRADLTPLSTKVAGLVASVAVSDYQAVKAGDLLVQLRDDDFRAQMQQAEAAVAYGENSLVHNERQRELQAARSVQAEEGIRAAQADIAAADAGIEAAKSSIVNARAAIEGSKADVDRTASERRRQEALIAAESTTRQKVEQVVADAERFRANHARREADLSTANAHLSSRQADLARSRAKLEGTRAELEAQKRQRAVLDSQELLLHADVRAKRA